MSCRKNSSFDSTPCACENKHANCGAAQATAPFFAALTAKREELASELSTLVRDGLHVERSAEIMEQQDGIIRRERAGWNAGRLTRRIAEIDAALARIADGTFGICVDCDEPINRKRLEAAQWATRCVRCQEEAERC